MAVDTQEHCTELQGSLFNDSVPVLLQQRKEIDDRIASLQAACVHPGATKLPKADTGNYDPSTDQYWYECACPVCLKQWQEDQ